MKTRPLYKFMEAKYCQPLIDTGLLKVARLSDLNDPYDLVPCVLDSDTGLVLNADHWREWSLDWLSNRHGLVCLSKTIKDPALWAHYADKHCGVALELHPPHDPNLFDVTYKQERALLPLAKVLNPLLFTREDMIALLSRKSLSWEYEEEVRFVVPLEFCEKHNDNYFLPIPEGFLKSIILGYRTTEQDADALYASLSASPFKDVTIKQASLSDRTFEIEIQHSGRGRK